MSNAGDANDAFGASLKLALSGYHQNGGLFLRDVLETTFLLDLFQRRPFAHRAVAIWRQEGSYVAFSPVKVREALDLRDGNISKRPFEMYEMFSELAGHPNMNSRLMMRPEKGGDALLARSWKSRPYMQAFVRWVGLRSK